MTHAVATAVLAGLAMLLAGCGSAASAPPPAIPPAVELPPPEVSYWTLGGRAADRRTIQLHQGPGHCGWESMTIISISNPLGQELTPANTNQYLRDPLALFADITAGRFEPSVLPPPDATFTGYRWGSMELWLSAGVGLDAVFLRRDGTWERWPRATEPFGCM